MKSFLFYYQNMNNIRNEWNNAFTNQSSNMFMCMYYV